MVAGDHADQCFAKKMHIFHIVFVLQMSSTANASSPPPNAEGCLPAAGITNGNGQVSPPASVAPSVTTSPSTPNAIGASTVKAQVSPPASVAPSFLPPTAFRLLVNAEVSPPAVAAPTDVTPSINSLKYMSSESDSESDADPPASVAPSVHTSPSTRNAAGSERDAESDVDSEAAWYKTLFESSDEVVICYLTLTIPDVL